MAEKVFTLIYQRTGRPGGSGDEKEIKGTLPELIDYFSYTLEIGASYNPKVNRHPKTIKSFLKSLQQAYEEKEASCYQRTYVSLKQDVV